MTPPPTNKKAQLDYPILGFAIVAVGLIILAPIMLKTMNTIKNTVGPALGNATGGEQAQTNFDTTMGWFTGWWDQIVLAAFAFSIILLLISSFLIDTHPMWVILYIFLAMMLVLFLPNFLIASDALYDSSQFAVEVSQLTFMDGLRSHLVEIIIGLIIVTGLIIYGKVNYFPSSGGGGGGSR